MFQNVSLFRDKVKKSSISIDNLTVRYKGKLALKDITLNIESSKITGIIGSNGAGKSTLIKGIMGLIPRESGVIKVGEGSLGKSRKDIAYVEQRSALDLSFPINVEELVTLGLYPKLGLFRRPKKSDKDKVYNALKKINMDSFASVQIGELSGGQLQRVFLARALVQEANIILLDEPFVGIDITSEGSIMSLLKQLSKEGKTIIIVHHDLNKVVNYFDNLIILKKSLVAYGSVKETFKVENIQNAYGNTVGDIFIKGVDVN